MLTSEEFALVIEKWSFVAHLDEDAMAKLRMNASVRTLSKGEVLHDRKRALNAIILVKSGLLRIYTENRAGQQLLLFYIPPGQTSLLPAPHLCLSSALDYRIEAAEKTEAILLDEKLISDYEESNPKIRGIIDSHLAGRLANLFGILKSMVSDDLTTRIINYLNYLAEIFSSDEIPVTHQMISQDLNCRREVVTRILSRLQANGQVELKRGSIKVLKRPLEGL